jgi:hypothetical protein
MSSSSGQGSAVPATCQWQWVACNHDWEKVPGKDYCHGSAKCHKPKKPPHGKPEPADGTIIVRLCK